MQRWSCDEGRGDVIGWAGGVEEELTAPKQNNEGLMKMTAGLKVKCLYLTSVPSGVESYMCFSQSSVIFIFFYMTNSVLICLLFYGA